MWGKPLEESPATHVSGYFFSPAPPRLVSGSAFCGKTLRLCFAPWWLPGSSTQGLCNERCLAYTLVVPDHLPKGRREWTTRASCWQNQVRLPYGRESWSTEPVLRKSLFHSTSSPAPCLVCTVHPATCMFNQCRASFRKVFFLPISLGRGRHHCWASGFCLQPCPQIPASRHQLHPPSSAQGSQPRNTATCLPGWEEPSLLCPTQGECLGPAEGPCLLSVSTQL